MYAIRSYYDFGGFTLNLMTLGGLALGVGMMVDSSVVVLENIFRRKEEQGEEPATAAVEGAREVGGAIVASTGRRRSTRSRPSTIRRRRC